MSPSATSAPETLPISKRIAYAIGQFGWALGDFGVLYLIQYFYFPQGNSQGTSNFPLFISTAPLLGIGTLLGLLIGMGRVWDAVTDPIVAHLSDNNKHPWGRRRIFLAVSTVPFAIFSVLIFMPPVAEVSPLNGVWLGAMQLLFYVFSTAYIVPFTAMLSEIGHSPRERLDLSTMAAFAYSLGFAVGSSAYSIQALFEAQHSSTTAFQITVVILASIAFLARIVPVIFIDERRYARPGRGNQKLGASVLTALKNKNFLRFAGADITYWMSFAFITSGVSYFVTLIIGLPYQSSSLILASLVGASLLCYIPVNGLSKRMGKKWMMLLAFGLFGLLFITFIAIGYLPLAPAAKAAIIVVMGAFPTAILAIVPPAILSDISEADGIQTGEFKAGIYFGARNLIRKLGTGIAGVILPSFLLLGQSVENPTGVYVTALVSGGLCALGFISFLFYKEHEVQRVLDEGEKKPPETR